MYWIVREHSNPPPQVKRQRCSPPAPGTTAFKQLPAVSIPFVFFFPLSFLNLFGRGLSDSAGAPALGSSAPRYVSFYIDSLRAILHSPSKAGLSSNSCVMMFAF